MRRRSNGPPRGERPPRRPRPPRRSRSEVEEDRVLWRGTMRNHQATRPQSGSPIGSAFTLIEILVVVLIIGIAAAIVVPQLGTRDDMKAASAARVIMADLIYAQNLAITQQ